VLQLLDGALDPIEPHSVGAIALAARVQALGDRTQRARRRGQRSACERLPRLEPALDYAEPELVLAHGRAVQAHRTLDRGHVVVVLVAHVRDDARARARTGLPARRCAPSRRGAA